VQSRFGCGRFVKIQTERRPTTGVNRDVAAVALSVALWVAGPLVVLEAVAGIGIGPWPALSAAVAAVVGLAVLVGFRTELASVDHLWSRMPVRATVGVASTAAGAGVVAAAELVGWPTQSVDVGAASIAGIALLTVGAAGVATVLGRANRRRIEAERELVTLGRRYDAPGRWAQVLWVGAAVVHFGLAGASLAYTDGSYATFAFAQGVVSLCLVSTSTARTWEVGDRGLVGGAVEHQWSAVESVRVDGGAVRVRVDSPWRALGRSGLRRSLRFAREGVDERAVELLATHAKTVGEQRHYADTAEY
jgi:hypothetical protein